MLPLMRAVPFLVDLVVRSGFVGARGLLLAILRGVR